MTTTLRSEGLARLREFLERRGYTLEDRPHQAFLARREGCVVNAYLSGKVVLGGADPLERAAVEDWLAGRPERILPERGLPPIEVQGERIGVDEAGKGDYFGPLVVAGVVVDDALAARLRAEGVKDSKRLSERAIASLSEKLTTSLLPRSHWTLVRLDPRRYNELYAQTGNLNRLLAWAHARAIEDLAASRPEARTAVSDQFGNERYLQQALLERGRGLSLVQTPQGEREVAVAAASILARAEFVAQVKLLSARYDLALPLGASQVEEAARTLVARRGPLVLLDTAKVHFATTQRVLPDRAPLDEALGRDRGDVDPS